MFVRILAIVAVCQLAFVCAAPAHRRRLKPHQLYVATANDLRHHRAVRSAQHQRLVSPTVVDQPASDKNGVRLRSKRAAIVNGFTSWDYEPFDKMGAFRSGRGE